MHPMQVFFVALTVFVCAFYGKSYVGAVGPEWAVAPTLALMIIAGCVAFGSLVAAGMADARRR